MQFSLQHSIEVLARTPMVLEQMLLGISENWTQSNEGGQTWSAFDVIGHLIYGEQTDWMVRCDKILNTNGYKKFEPFDRFAQFENSKGKTLPQLLQEFRAERQANIDKLISLNITESDFAKTGLHPTFGAVTLSQLIAAWVVHDLDHIAQVSRIMAKQYKDETGPWIAFLKILGQS